MTVSVTPPISLGSLPPTQVAQFRAVVDKVVCASVVDGMGKDLLLRVYMAGLYHGTCAANGWRELGEGKP